MIDSLRSNMNEWRSKRGRSRAENRDACGVHISNEKILAAVVDAAEVGVRGMDYARHWVQQILRIGCENSTLTHEQLVSAMRQAHSEQQAAGYLSEIAAYAVLVIDLKGGLSWALNCGDCRIGCITKKEELRWLTPVHTCANPLGEDFTAVHSAMSSRHILTRRLRVKRFDEPALTLLDQDSVRSWLLATDGYWVENLENLDENVNADYEDDASVLHLNSLGSNIKRPADCENLIVHDQTIDSPVDALRQ